jgi:hypothetical protein
VRVVLCTLPVLTALSTSLACAQSAATPTRPEYPTAIGGTDARSLEAPEEIVVRGRRLEEFRLEVEKLRVRAYDIFNEINSSDDFDVHCATQQRTGTRRGRLVCAAQFEVRISSRAAKDYMAAIKDACGGQLAQDCMFDPNMAGRGLAAAKAVEGEAPRHRHQLNQEIQRLARTNLELGQAILDFYDANSKYEEERKRPRERRRER